MDNGFVLFLLGALVSIPVAVLAPFATRHVEQWTARRNEKRAKIRIKRLTQDFAQIRDFAYNRNLLTNYLVGQILLITIISFVGTLLASLFVGIGSMWYAIIRINSPLIADNAWAETISNVIGMLCQILTIGIALPIGLRALRIHNYVNNFEKYEGQIKAQLTEIGGNLVVPEPDRDGRECAETVHSRTRNE